MSEPFCVVIDTETGGLDCRLHPLLSVSFLLGDRNLDEMDGGLSLNVIPPPGTVIEIPAFGDQVPEMKAKRIVAWMDVHTKTLHQRCPDDCMVIKAVAAEINGYITNGPDGKWDIEAIDRWHAKAMTMQQVDGILCSYLGQAFPKTKCLGVAHNADFDMRFVGRNMPESIKRIVDPWYCTMKLLRKWYGDRNHKNGSAKLASLAEIAGHKPRAAHEALEDCRSCLSGLRWLLKGPDPLRIAG